MTQITEEEKHLVSKIQRGFAFVNHETGEVIEGLSLKIGRLRKKFIPNRRNLGLRDRFEWEIQELETRTGLYQESCLPSLVPYATN
jgi:hypothetical protein